MPNPHKPQVFPVFSDDDNDLASIRWGADKDGYARGYRGVNIRAHRVVMERMCGCPLTANDICDHIDRNKLNNQRDNLRLVDKSSNNLNQPVRKPYGRSGVTGVAWHAAAGRWQAVVRRNRVTHYLGLFDSVQDAAIAVAEKRSYLETHEPIVIETVMPKLLMER